MSAAMIADKWLAAENRANRRIAEAVRQAGGDSEHARELLWCWARQDTALRADLLRVAIAKATEQGSQA